MTFYMSTTISLAESCCSCANFHMVCSKVSAMASTEHGVIQDLEILNAVPIECSGCSSWQHACRIYVHLLFEGAVPSTAIWMTGPITTATISLVQPYHHCNPSTTVTLSSCEADALKVTDPFQSD